MLRSGMLGNLSGAPFANMILGALDLKVKVASPKIGGPECRT